MLAIMSALAVIGGLFFAIQGPTNSALGNRTNVFAATTTSFGVGTLLLLFIVTFFGAGDFGALADAQPWQLVGGVYGAVNVLTTISVMPIVGVSLTITTVMLAQLLMGAVIDWFGLFGCARVPVAPLRLFGILVVAAGILLVYFAGTGSGAKIKSSADTSAPSGMRPRQLLLLPAAFLGGILGTIQTPANASLAGLIGNWEGTLFSFGVGFVSIALVTLIRHFVLAGRSRAAASGTEQAAASHMNQAAISGTDQAADSERGISGILSGIASAGIRPWMLLGGCYGVAGIFLNLFTVTVLGTALQVACSMVGQLFGALVIDSLGLLQTKKIPISPLRAVGILVITIGMILVTLAKGM